MCVEFKALREDYTNENCFQSAIFGKMRRGDILDFRVQRIRLKRYKAKLLISLGLKKEFEPKEV